MTRSRLKMRASVKCSFARAAKKWAKSQCRRKTANFPQTHFFEGLFVKNVEFKKGLRIFIKNKFL